MSFPKYEAYKDSGVEWLGEVPEHWDVSSLKWLSPVLRGASPRPIEDPKYFEDEGEYGWVRIADVSASNGYLFETTQRLSPLGSSLSVKLDPESLFLSIAGSVGKPCITKIKACIHDGFVYFPQLSIDQRLLYRVFENGLCFGGLGKMGTQLNLNTETVGGIRIALPPSDELDKILDFLDRETARIDALIAEQQRLIELLKEKRQAVISHAVTKGLDSTAPLKDSGVEWLGEVPEHWEVLSLKRVVVFQRGHDLPTDSRQPGEVPVVSSGGYSGSHNIACAKAPGIVTGRYGSIGSFILVVQDYWPLNTALYSIDLYENEPRYVWYLLQSHYEHFVLNSLKSAVPGVDRNDIHTVKVALAPKEEQFQIVLYLDHLCEQLEQLTTEANKNIDLLQERRSALISAAVTGKIDVRSWQAPANAAPAPTLKTTHG
jgi:type I restriction enzyme, S subunit